jgi:hypothetical protein
MYMLVTFQLNKTLLLFHAVLVMRMDTEDGKEIGFLPSSSAS